MASVSLKSWSSTRRFLSNHWSNWISHAKANPGKISFATPGYGTQPHLLGEMLKLTTGIKHRARSLQGACTSQSPICWQGRCKCISTPLLVSSHIEAGKAHGSGVADETRSPQLPAVRRRPKVGLQRCGRHSGPHCCPRGHFAKHRHAG